MKIFISLIAVFYLFSCNRAEKVSTTKITLNIPNFSLNQNIKKTKNIKPNKFNPDGSNNPTAINEIDCFGIMVSGPEASLTQNQCKYASGNTFNVGFFAGGFPAYQASGTSGFTFSADIPSGNDRVIRLIGFKTDISKAAADGVSPSAICSQFFIKSEYEKYLSDPFQIAIAGQLLMPPGGTVNVSMIASLDTNLEIKDCEGPNFQNGGGSGNQNGPPSKFAILFQDNAGSSGSKRIANNSCVGVKFQLRDANNAPANMSANPQINAVISLGNPAAGTLYSGNTNAAGACEAADIISTVGGNVTVQFYNTSAGGTAFSDLNLFFKPNTQSSVSPVISITDTSSSLTPAFLQYVYGTPLLTPYKYGLYDFYNNRSTAGTSSANRSFVRANECRPMSLCFLDDNGVPAGKTGISGGSDSIYINDNAPIGSIKFYANSTDCTNSVAASEDWSIQFGSVGTTDSKYFYYKVLNPTLTNFSFSVNNMGNGSGGVIASPSSDFTFGSNFWGVSPN